MLTISQIKQRLGDANLKQVAIKSGVHPATVYRFMRDQGKPTYETVELLSNYLTQDQVDEVLKFIPDPLGELGKGLIRYVKAGGIFKELTEKSEEDAA
jgi:transcriptional regulator with XRE-family HTH domain